MIRSSREQKINDKNIFKAKNWDSEVGDIAHKEGNSAVILR